MRRYRLRMCCWFRDRKVTWLVKNVGAVLGGEVYLLLQNYEDVKEIKPMGVDSPLTALFCTPLVVSLAWFCYAGPVIKGFIFCMQGSLSLCILNRNNTALFRFVPPLDKAVLCSLPAWYCSVFSTNSLQPTFNPALVVLPFP